MEKFEAMAKTKCQQLSINITNSLKYELNESTQQDTADRRVIRSHYFAMQKLINERRHDLQVWDSKKFMSIFNEVEDLHQHVEKPREQVADAEALLDLASTLVASVKSHTSAGISTSDFISCLLRDFGQQGRRGVFGDTTNSILWKDIGFIVSPIFKNGKGCCTMLGPMKNELKQRKVAAYRKRTRPTESARPEKLDDTAAEEKTDTHQNMSTMFEILRKKKNVKHENLLLNRKSFAQTVENLFALSFLVKDGRVVIFIDEKGSQIVSPRNAPAPNSVMSGEVTYNHFVFRLDFKDWKLMKDSVPDGEELMPHRDINISGASQVQNDSQATLGLTPVKKLSRNRGLVIQEELIGENSTEIGGSTTYIRKCKRKLQ